MNDDEDEKAYNRVIKVLAELHDSWRIFQDRTTAEITEYKKTVNNAISLLATEAFKHQSDTTKRLEDDAIERRARQAIVDSATAQVREEMLTSRAETLTRLDASAATVRAEMLDARAEASAHSATHEKRAGRERMGLSVAMGCLLVLMLVMLLVLVALIASLYWSPRP